MKDVQTDPFHVNDGLFFSEVRCEKDPIISSHTDTFSISNQAMFGYSLMFLFTPNSMAFAPRLHNYCFLLTDLDGVSTLMIKFRGVP